MRSSQQCYACTVWLNTTSNRLAPCCRVDAITLPEVVLENWAHLADMPVTQLDLAALAEEEPMVSTG